MKSFKIFRLTKIQIGCLLALTSFFHANSLLSGPRVDQVTKWIKTRAELTQVIKLGNEERAVAIVQELKDPNVSTIDDQGLTPLMEALEAGNESMARRLLGLKADVDARDTRGRTALMRLLGQSKMPLKKMLRLQSLLITAGADINETDRNGMTVLMHACDSSVHHGILARIAVAKSDTLHSQSEDGQSALMIAAKHTNESLIRQLHTLGSRVDQVDDLGRSAIFYAALAHQPRMVTLLASLGANVNQIDNQGMTPLMCMVIEGNVPVADALIKAGAKLDVCTKHAIAIQHRCDDGFERKEIIPVGVSLLSLAKRYGGLAMEQLIEKASS